MIVTVEAKGPFGVLAAEDKKWKSISNKALRDSLAVGKAYEVVMDKVKCEDGKTRTQVVKASEVIANAQEAIKAAAPIAKAAAPKAEPIKAGLGVAEKDSRILVQGLTQALLQSSEMTLRGDDEPFEVFVEERVMQLVEIVKKLSKVS